MVLGARETSKIGYLDPPEVLSRKAKIVLLGDSGVASDPETGDLKTTQVYRKEALRTSVLYTSKQAKEYVHICTCVYTAGCWVVFGSRNVVVRVAAAS